MTARHALNRRTPARHRLADHLPHAPGRSRRPFPAAPVLAVGALALAGLVAAAGHGVGHMAPADPTQPPTAAPDPQAVAPVACTGPPPERLTARPRTFVRWAAGENTNQIEERNGS